MGRYRTDLSFKLAAPDEVRIYRDGQHVGDIFKDEDILAPVLRFAGERGWHQLA